jgi:hypothetical protein
MQSLEAVKCSHESRGTKNQEWLCWPGPAAIYQKRDSQRCNKRNAYTERPTSALIEEEIPLLNTYISRKKVLGHRPRRRLKPRMTLLAKAGSNLSDLPKAILQRMKLLQRAPDSLSLFIARWYWFLVFAGVSFRPCLIPVTLCGAEWILNCSRPQTERGLKYTCILFVSICVLHLSYEMTCLRDEIRCKDAKWKEI